MLFLILAKNIIYFLSRYHTSTEKGKVFIRNMITLYSGASQD